MRLLELCRAKAFGGLEIHVSDFSTWIAGSRPDVELFLGVGRDTRLDRRLTPLGRPMLRFDRRRSLVPFGNILLGARRLARFVKDHCPVVEFGLVGKTMHKVDERIEVAQIEALKAIYARILRDYFA